jgi:DNA-binding transcriptional regulator YiaG
MTAAGHELVEVADLVAEREAARSRHPSMHMAIDLDRMRRREAQRLAAAGHPWPHQAALLVAARGRTGLDRAGFATSLGVPEAVVAAIEDGTPVDAAAGARRLVSGAESAAPSR